MNGEDELGTCRYALLLSLLLTVALTGCLQVLPYDFPAVTDYSLSCELK